MNNLPFLSIIISVYNGEKTIGECIESLLSQDYPKQRYEIIVVDNKSTDKTAQVIKQYPVLCLEERAIQGDFAARNRGIKQARGQILAFTNADCIASSEWIKEGVIGFAEDEIGCVAGEIKGYEPQNYVEEYLCKRNILTQEEKPSEFPFPYAKGANAFYRKIVLDKIGLFEEKWKTGGDADICWRMQLETNYKIKFVQGATIFHKHRSTVFSMYKQCFKWGIGYTNLYRKYQSRMPRRSLKQTVWIFRRLIYILLKIAIFVFYKEKLSKEEKDRYLELIAFMGWEIGRIVGSVKNHVFAI